MSENTCLNVGNNCKVTEMLSLMFAENDKAIENGFSSEKPASQEEDKYSSGARKIRLF